MNSDERVQIGELWIGLAQTYGRDLSRAALTVMLNAISDLQFDAVKKAMNQWAGYSKLNRHPSPAELREIILPTIPTLTTAREAASRAIEAVSKFGWCNSADARSYIGELGWKGVERFGGWQYVCENLGTTLDVTIFQAQLRDICETTLTLGAHGLMDTPPTLPEKKRTELTSISDIVNIIPKRIE